MTHRPGGQHRGHARHHDSGAQQHLGRVQETRATEAGEGVCEAHLTTALGT